MALFRVIAPAFVIAMVAGCQPAPPPAGGDKGVVAPAGRLDKIVDAWLGEVSKRDVGGAGLTVARNGRKQRSVTRDRATDRFAIASLSKAITGACLQHLIEDGSLRADTAIREVFGPGLSDLSGARAQYGGITLAQLVTHTSGLWPDQTQGAMGAWRGETGTRHAFASARALARPQQDGTPGQFRYNNENYAILGAVIDKVARGGYVNYCGSRVLGESFANGSARLSPRYGAYAAWGGWEMATSDYIDFFNRYFGPGSKMGSDPFAWPHAELNRGAHYGMGVFFRRFEGGLNFWHNGRLCFRGGEGVGTFAAIWKGDWSVTTGQARCATSEQMADLDRALARAALR